MFKKKLLLMSVLFFSLGSITQSSAMSLTAMINYFDFGYRVGVSPLLWPNIPAMALGHYLPSVPKGEQTFAYAFGSAGLVTGVAVLGLAVYGLKKIVSHHRKGNTVKV